MNTLRKIFMVVICALVICPAHAKFYAGYRNECWVDDKGSDEYWFCGKQVESCQGNKATKSNKKNWKYNGESFTHDGRTFWCCGGTTETEGKFVEGAEWATSSTKQTISVGGGTAECTIKATICGTTEKSGCLFPTSCPDDKELVKTGLIVRKCVDKCDSAKGLYWDGSKCATKTSTETKKSDDSCTGLTKGLDANGKCVTCTGTDYIFDTARGECVYCPETEHQGVNAKGVCYSCQGDYFRWDPVTKDCVFGEYAPKKNATKTYSNDMMYECYGCSSDVQFKKCLEIYRTAPDELSNIQKSVLKACNNTYDAANAKKMVAALKTIVPDTTDSSEETQKIDLTKKQKDMVLANKELLEATKQQTQVSDVVAVADQVM